MSIHPSHRPVLGGMLPPPSPPADPGSSPAAAVTTTALAPPPPPFPRHPAYPSLAERYARIVADEGIAGRVPQAAWQGAVDVLISHAREGRVADGFTTAIERCADVLATHFPATGAPRDDLPDRIYIL